VATVVKPNAHDICVECKTHSVSTPAVKVIYVEVGDVKKRRIPLCQKHYDELCGAMKAMDALFDKQS
jgi:hypothetical protein